MKTNQYRRHCGSCGSCGSPLAPKTRRTLCRYCGLVRLLVQRGQYARWVARTAPVQVAGAVAAGYAAGAVLRSLG